MPAQFISVGKKTKGLYFRHGKEFMIPEGNFMYRPIKAMTNNAKALNQDSIGKAAWEEPSFKAVWEQPAFRHIGANAAETGINFGPEILILLS